MTYELTHGADRSSHSISVSLRKFKLTTPALSFPGQYTFNIVQVRDNNDCVAILDDRTVMILSIFNDVAVKFIQSSPTYS